MECCNNNVAFIADKAHVRRAAINLNNSGVVLLQRGMYNNAMEVLKDSVRLIKTCVTDQDTISYTDINVTLHTASQKVSLSSTIMLSSSTNNCKQTSDGKRNLRIERISSQCSPSLIQQAILQKSLKDVLFPITIDPFESQQDEVQDHLSSRPNPLFTDLESSIILYNYALAHRSLAMISSSSSDDDMIVQVGLQQASLRLLSLTERILSNLIENYDGDNNNDNTIASSLLFGPIMLVKILVTLSLVQVYSELDLLVQSEDYYEELEDLLYMIYTKRYLLSDVDQKVAPAA